MKIYLGGPIRVINDTINEHDVKWRSDVINKLNNICCLDPVINNYNDESNQIIYAKDVLMLNDCLVGVFNMIPFCKDNYPSIGALWEIGYLTAQHKRCFIILPEITECEGEEYRKNTLLEHPMLSNCIFLQNFDSFIDIFK